jgi:EXS family
MFLLTAAWWDVAMDWSLMKRHAPYPLLRPDLGYEKIWVFPVCFDLTKAILLRDNNEPDNAFIVVILCCVSGSKPD